MNKNWDRMVYSKDWPAAFSNRMMFPTRAEFAACKARGCLRPATAGDVSNITNGKAKVMVEPDTNELWHFTYISDGDAPVVYRQLKKIEATVIHPQSGRPEKVNELTWKLFIHALGVADTDPVLAVHIVQLVFKVDREATPIFLTREFVQFAKKCDRVLRVMSGIGK